ncbi:DUF4148 domain-containing protein [Variovorax sp. JS1663]|uniref:DUF4148 domain-containing protein n=1 Tax=Variovorax sp. JS1663 TaxID=1851577 RepID=UPI000B3482F6|nr:DUF4148 domain-containing protein [Variovorax sp. JS1663]OUM02832.1 DUF4148 domain-containing protein [Variovorax sp. JS1663]
MKITFRRFVPLAAVGFASLASLGAQAFQGEQNPLPPQPFQPSLSRAAVQQDALRPVQISNGGTGVAMPARLADRATVRSEARAISAKGAATYGEIQR